MENPTQFEVMLFVFGITMIAAFMIKTGLSQVAKAINNHTAAIDDFTQRWSNYQIPPKYSSTFYGTGPFPTPMTSIRNMGTPSQYDDT